MIEQIQQPWPWYVAGVLIGLIVPALLILGNKTFGISSNLRHVCAACFPADIPFFKYDWKKEIWNFLSRYDINGLRANCSLSIENIEEAHFQVYPNPSNDEIVVQGEFLSEQPYELIDALGKQLITGQLNNSKHVIDLSNLDSDVYFLKLNNQTIRIVKTNN